MKTFERRMAVESLEFRDDSDGFTLNGYASTFNQAYDMGWYQESVDPAAFKRTLGQNPDVRLLINHDGLPLARTTSKTLDLDTDKRGLRVSAHLDPTDPDVASLAPKMRRGDLNQMSFGFRTTEDEWSDNMSKRVLRSLDLNNGDVSVVTYPANPNASVGLRAGGTPFEAMASAIRSMEARNAPEDEVLELLARMQRAYGGVPLDARIGEAMHALGEHVAAVGDALESLVPEVVVEEVNNADLVDLEMRRLALQLV